MEVERELQSREVAVAGCLGRLLQHRFESVLPGDPAVARIAAADGEIAANMRSALAQMARIALLLETEEIDGTSSRIERKAIYSHRVQLGQLRKQYAHIVNALSAYKRRLTSRTVPRRIEPGPEDGDAPSSEPSVEMDSYPKALRSASTKSNGKPLQRKSMLARSSAASTAAALRRSRAQMQQELERIGAVTGLLQQDVSSIDRTAIEHEGYAGEVAEAKARAKAYSQQQSRDRLAMLAAFLLLAFSAGYIIARRVLWTFVGIRLP